MNPERRKALKKTQRICIVVQVVMCALYISAGILLAVADTAQQTHQSI